MRPHQRLLAIPAVGPLVAAKTLGETHNAQQAPQRHRLRGTRRCRSRPRSSGNTHRHRLARGATGSSTEGKTAAEGHPCLKPTSRGVVYRARLKDLDRYLNTFCTAMYWLLLGCARD